MHPALQGLLIGVGIALVLLIFEYMSANRSAAERGKKMAKKPELSQDERARIASMARFCFFLPIIVAVVYWLVAKWL